MRVRSTRMPPSVAAISPPWHRLTICLAMQALCVLPIRRPIAIPSSSKRKPMRCSSVLCPLFSRQAIWTPYTYVLTIWGYGIRYGKLRYELRLFREEIDDLIMTQEIGDLSRYRNSDSAEIKGIEVQLESRIDWLDTRLTANYAYTLMDSDNIDAAVSESAPRHNGSFLVIHRLPGDWTLSESFTYMSSVTHLLWDPVPVVRKLDARLKKTWRTGDTGKLSLSLAALNLLEQDAYIHPIEERGREYRAEIAIQF